MQCAAASAAAGSAADGAADDAADGASANGGEGDSAHGDSPNGDANDAAAEAADLAANEAHAFLITNSMACFFQKQGGEEPSNSKKERPLLPLPLAHGEA